MISLIWTASPLPASKIIKWITGEESSHFAVVIDQKYVFHSNFYGAHLKWLSSFLKHSYIVRRMDLNLSPAQEETIYLDLINRFDEQPYDWGAFFYLIIRGVLYKAFGVSLPRKNIWGSSRGFLCLEIAKSLDCIKPTLLKLDAITPETLYWRLKEDLNDYIA